MSVWAVLVASPIVAWCATRLVLFILAVLAQCRAKLSNADVVRLLNATALKFPTGTWAALTGRRSGGPPTSSP